MVRCLTGERVIHNVCMYQGQLENGMHSSLVLNQVLSLIKPHVLVVWQGLLPSKTSKTHTHKLFPSQGLRKFLSEAYILEFFISICHRIQLFWNLPSSEARYKHSNYSKF